MSLRDNQLSCQKTLALSSRRDNHHSRRDRQNDHPDCRRLPIQIVALQLTISQATPCWGAKERDQLELFISGSLRQLIPDDHVLARVDRVLDLTWLRAEVAECYRREEGRPGIDPEVAVRLDACRPVVGIVHDRKLMREAVVNIAIRWFVGYGLRERLPHHSRFYAHPSALGRGAVRPDLQTYGRSLPQSEDCHSRGRAHRCFAHSSQRELGKPRRTSRDRGA